MNYLQDSGIYLKIKVRLIEFKIALIKLGFAYQNSDDEFHYYFHKRQKMKFRIPARVKDEDFVPPVELLLSSNLMVKFDVLKRADDLADLLLEIQKGQAIAA